MTGALALCLAAGVLAQAAPAEPGARAVTAEAPIVAGNAASAKDRALADAFRQAVERSLAGLLAEMGMAEPLPPAVAQLRGQLFSRARRFVRSYRILEQAEEAGRIRLQVDAEVDEALLRREIERARGGGAPAARAGARSVLLAGAPPEAVAALSKALGGAGVKSERPPGGAADEARARAAAQHAGAAAAALVSAEITPEGPVRGTPRVSAACRLGVRVLPAGGGPALDRATEARAFADGDEAARGECLERAAGELARQVAAALTAAASPGEGRPITLDLDLVEPAALPILLQALRKLGAAPEVRRVTVGHVELRVVSPLAAPALLSALAREVSSTLSVAPGPAAPDRIAAQVRLVAAGEAP